MSRKARPAPAGRASGAKPRVTGPGASQRAPARNPALERACLFSPLAALAALAWSLRGAPLGTPVADDFEFLFRVGAGPQFGFFDSMGATYYWRPLSRQVWFSIMTPLLFAAPAVVAAIHFALLGAIAFVLARLARRSVSWPAAALVGAAILATEPARALLAWPSGIQHLLAALGLALTAHEVLAGRRWTAALAAVAAALSHDLGALAFVLLGAGGLLRREGPSAWRDAALAAVLAAGYATGYRVALAHGVHLPAGGASHAAGAWPEAVRLGTQAAFNTETLHEPWTGPARVVTALIFAVSLAVVLRPQKRGSLRGAIAWLGIPLAVALIGLAPLGSLLPDWNSWRAFVPVLALSFVIALAAARAHLALGLALVALRIASLAGAEPAGRVTGDPPPAVSDLSFARLTRMQKVVGSSGEIVRATKLPPGALVAYVGLPEMTLNGFRGHVAVQVWTRDTSARFVAYVGAPEAAMNPDLVLSYDARAGHDPVLALVPEAILHWSIAEGAGSAGRTEEAREHYLLALAAQKPESPSLSANALQNLALYELEAGHLRQADSLNKAADQIRGLTPNGLALDALIALRRGNLTLARNYLAACLRLDPSNSVGRGVVQELQAAEAQGRIPPASTP